MADDRRLLQESVGQPRHRSSNMASPAYPEPSGALTDAQIRGGILALLVHSRAQVEALRESLRIRELLGENTTELRTRLAERTGRPER